MDIKPMNFKMTICFYNSVCVHTPRVMTPSVKILADVTTVKNVHNISFLKVTHDLNVVPVYPTRQYQRGIIVSD